LNKHTFEQLRPDAFEEPHDAFVLDYVQKHLGEGLEGPAIPFGGRFGLQADFGDNEGLRGECCGGFG
jgi:hypothetical protein